MHHLLLPLCNEALLTKIDYAYDADAYFPNLDENPDWEITGDSEEQTYFDLEFYFYRYEKELTEFFLICYHIFTEVFRFIYKIL